MTTETQPKRKTRYQAYETPTPRQDLYRVRLQYHHLTKAQVEKLMMVLHDSPFGMPTTRDQYPQMANMECQICPPVYETAEEVEWDFDPRADDQIQMQIVTHDGINPVEED